MDYRFRAVLAFMCTLSFSVHSSPECNAIAQSSSEYKEAINLIQRLPELKIWSKLQSFPIAFGEPFDKQELVNEKCFWSVSVYANRPDRLEPWRSFFVHLETKTILVQPQDGDSPMSLSEWRKVETK